MGSFKTGNWGIKKDVPGSMVGIVQQMDHRSFLSSLMTGRRICSQLNERNAGIEPRQVQTWGYGFLCPAETQEGMNEFYLND
jgi:DNA-directed RNA polymerase beta subunit